MDTDKSIRASVENGGKLKVTYFHRLRLPDVHFSIESIFARTRIELADSVQAKVVTSPFRSRGLFRRIWNVIVARQQQSEINHVTGDVNFLTIGMNRRKTILTHHDSYFIDRTSGLRRELLRLVWLKLPVACSRFVTTVSEATKQELVQLIDCDPDRIVVIHNAISDQFQPFHKPFDFARPRILQMGTAVNKNIESLAVALRGLACKLIIVGRLSQQQRNVLEKSQIDFEMKVELSEDQVVEQYREADIVTLVSTIEGFGMPIVEAQVTGRVVVTGNCSSMPEIAGDGACLVDPFDAASIRAGFNHVIQDRSYREDLILRGLENARRFDQKQIAQQYLTLYQKIVAETRSQQ